jgi:hypothetical protein
MSEIGKFLEIYPKGSTVGGYRAGIYDFFDSGPATVMGHGGPSPAKRVGGFNL